MDGETQLRIYLVKYMSVEFIVLWVSFLVSSGKLNVQVPLAGLTRFLDLLQQLT